MIDLDEQLERCLEALRRDVNHLMTESAGKKLSPSSARDLATYTKLLHELTKKQKSELDDLGVEELEKLAGV
jgi:hypothetical protein